MSEWKNICEMEKIIPGGCEMADLEDTEIVICNLGGEFYAIEDAILLVARLSVVRSHAQDTAHVSVSRTESA